MVPYIMIQKSGSLSSRWAAISHKKRPLKLDFQARKSNNNPDLAIQFVRHVYRCIFITTHYLLVGH